MNHSNKAKESSESPEERMNDVLQPMLRDDSGDRSLENWIERIEKSIVTKTDVSFADVVGYESVKSTLKDNIILPFKFPHLFRNREVPCGAFLLYGLYGTGKTLLARALATECNVNFIAVHSNDFILKSSSSPELLVRSLFELAQNRKPCLLFFDEIDQIFGRRSDHSTDFLHKVRIELITQMQNIDRSSSSLIFLAATAYPWLLDPGFRRRIQRFILIPLPNVDERVMLMKAQFGTNINCQIEENHWLSIAQQMENFSVSDIVVVCREAILAPIRRISQATHFKPIPNQQTDQPAELWLSCSPEDKQAISMTFDQIPVDHLAEPPVTWDDLKTAMNGQRIGDHQHDLMLLMRFHDEFGDST